MSLKVFDEVEDNNTITFESTDASINTLYSLIPVGALGVIKVVAEVVALCTVNDAGDVGGWHIEAVFKCNEEGVFMVGVEHRIVEEKDQEDWNVYFDTFENQIILKSVGNEGNTIVWKGKITTIFTNFTPSPS